MDFTDAAAKAIGGEEEEVTTPEQLIKTMAEMGETINLEEAQGMLQHGTYIEIKRDGTSPITQPREIGDFKWRNYG